MRGMLVPTSVTQQFLKTRPSLRHAFREEDRQPLCHSGDDHWVPTNEVRECGVSLCPWDHHSETNSDPMTKV